AGTGTATGGTAGAGLGGGTTGTGTGARGIIEGTAGTVTQPGTAGGAGTGSNGSITISGGAVSATGGPAGGAGIGGGASASSTNGNGGAGTGTGGTITADGGIITAIGGNIGGAGIGGGAPAGTGTPGAGANIAIGADAEIKAYSRGALPAIHASVLSPGGGFFANALLNTAVGTAAVTLYAETYEGPLHQPGTGTAKITMDMPANFRGYAFQIPADAGGSADYAMYIITSGGERCIVHQDEAGHPAGDDGYHIIRSIDSLDGYDADNGSAGDGVLPVKLEGMWTVTFDTKGGTPSVPTQNILKHGHTAAQPSNPANGIYVLSGWFYDAGTLDVKWIFTDAVVSDLDLYAIWVTEATVIFCDGDDTEIASETVPIGAPIPAGQIPAASPGTGYEAVWYTSSARTTEWIMTDNVTGDMTLYLRYDKIPGDWVDVRFFNVAPANVQMGETLNILKGTAIPSGQIPATSPPHAHAAIWYNGDARVTVWDLTDAVNNDLDLYLSYEPDAAALTITVVELGGTGTVTYMMNGGSPILYAGPFLVYDTDSVVFAAVGSSPDAFELWMIEEMTTTLAQTAPQTFSSDSTAYVSYAESGGTAEEEYITITKGDHMYGDILWSVDSSPFFVFPDSGSFKVTKGTQVTFSGVPDMGYTFFCFYGDVSSLVTPETFDGSASITVNALFYEDATPDDYIVITKGDRDNGDILWSPDGENYYPFPSADELYVTKGGTVYLKPVPDDDHMFVQWTNDVDPAADDPFVFGCSESITAGAIFSGYRTVTVRSDSAASFEYTITVTDPLTGEDVTRTGTFTFGRGGGAEGIPVPDGASFTVSVTSDHRGAGMEWDDGNPLTRQYGPIYAITVTDDMEITLFIESDEDTSFPWWILMFGLLFLLIFLDDDEEEICGKVRYKGKGVFGVKIGYTLNGGGRKEVVTDKDGDYAIPVDKGDTVVITDVSKGKSPITKDLPMEIHIEKDRTKVDFEF
ncbi:MAG: InlB B-repeat-containing protein, partial [Methanomassiliicoccaceae archaeon]|nr:InlB B-repeat-containing protein [Methanomassiliicoccaceae archaeon]